MEEVSIIKVFIIPFIISSIGRGMIVIFKFYFKVYIKVLMSIEIKSFKMSILSTSIYSLNAIPITIQS